jgi:hypothetical protein
MNRCPSYTADWKPAAAGSILAFMSKDAHPPPVKLKGLAVSYRTMLPWCMSLGLSFGSIDGT